MNAFNELRKEARRKRDQAIARITNEYDATLVSIAKLEQSLGGIIIPKSSKVAASVNVVIPNDRTFTLGDLKASLEASDPSRDWDKKTIGMHITKLMGKGIIKRIRRHHGTQPALYSRIDAEVGMVPFQDKTLIEVMQTVLGDGKARRMVELTVEMLEMGYHTTQSPENLRGHIGTELRGNPDLFVRNGLKWGLVNAMTE